MASARRRPFRIALLGFGHVGRRFVEGLAGPYGQVLRGFGARPLLTGIATARHGVAIDGRGLDGARCLAAVRDGRSLDRFHRGLAVSSSLEFIRRVPADVLLELSTLDPRRGEPATSHVRAALRRGLHVVTANKGPVAFSLHSLRALARRRRRQFRHEGAVMDGTPVFSLLERCLPGAGIRSLRGTLNSTTSLILARMEDGLAPSAALREAQALGIAEADPSFDLEGWDATVKLCALANATWDVALRPSRVRRQGIRAITALDVRRAARAGARLRLVARAERRGKRVVASVRPERVPLGDPLAGEGRDAALLFTTDLGGEVGVIQRGGTVDQTAYALLSDLVAILEPPASAPLPSRRSRRPRS